MDADLVASVKKHEGYRSKAYKDSVGVWTVGYGTNLQILEVDEPLASKWLILKLDEALGHAKTLPEYLILSDVRRAVIVEMIYNLGPNGYDGFINTRKAMREERYTDAAAGMLASHWAQQVGIRARRLAAQMRTGRRWTELQVP